MFDHILNWKLLKGSHGFPGPDGGTCINEAAIVAAGFEYRKIESCFDCPPCFSRPIATYAIALNDNMPDDLRQELLMPFVTRLAGTADKPEIESARIKMIAFRTIRDVLPIALRAAGLHEHAARCAAVKDFDAARYAADAAARYAAAAREIYTIAVSILDEAIKLGNQAAPIETALVVSRMETMKQRTLLTTD